MDGLKPICRSPRGRRWSSWATRCALWWPNNSPMRFWRSLIAGKLPRSIALLIKCDLFLLDEFGYLPVEPQVGPVLYELLAGRYGKGTTIITSNKSVATWGELVSDTAFMMAIIDRLFHHGEVFYLRGTSYRLKGKEPVTLTAKPAEGCGAASSERS